MANININKLKGRIVERGLTISELAVKMGIDPSTLYRKISNDGDTMLVSEANKIVSILRLSSEDAIAIFFAGDVA